MDLRQRDEYLRPDGVVAHGVVVLQNLPDRAQRVRDAAHLQNVPAVNQEQGPGRYVNVPADVRDESSRLHGGSTSSRPRAFRPRRRVRCSPWGWGGGGTHT